MVAWRDGDRRAGGELVRSHIKLVKSFFNAKVGEPQLVDELVQRTFVACVVGVERFRGDSNFRTWLFAIANNVLREHYREQRREERFQWGPISVMDSARGLGSMIASSQQRRRLLVALRRISAESRILLELYYWEDLTAPELAESLGIPVGTVRSRIGKAKLELRAELDTMARVRERSVAAVARPASVA